MKRNVPRKFELTCNVNAHYSMRLAFHFHDPSPTGRNESAEIYRSDVDKNGEVISVRTISHSRIR